jgi:hypothetical protein
MQKTVAAKGSPNLPACRQHRNPLSAPANLEDVDPVPGKGAPYTPLPLPQDSGENKNPSSSEFPQNFHQQFTKQVRSNDISLREFVVTNIGEVKLNCADFIHARIVLRSGDRDRIVINADYSSRAENQPRGSFSIRPPNSFVSFRSGPLDSPTTSNCNRFRFGRSMMAS